MYLMYTDLYNKRLYTIYILPHTMCMQLYGNMAKGRPALLNVYREFEKDNSNRTIKYSIKAVSRSYSCALQTV